MGYARVLELRKLNGKTRVLRHSVRAADTSLVVAVVQPLVKVAAAPGQGGAEPRAATRTVHPRAPRSACGGAERPGARRPGSRAPGPARAGPDTGG